MNIDKYFSSRRTVRSFSKKTVEPGLIRKMLAEATKAPTTGNMQLYSVITSATDESKQRLATTHFNQPCVTGCSVLLTFCIDMHRFYRWCAVSDAKPGFENLQMLMAAAIDCSIFAQQFNTIAEMNGLGCCYLGTTAYNAPQIAPYFNCMRISCRQFHIRTGTGSSACRCHIAQRKIQFTVRQPNSQLLCRQRGP